MRYAIQSWSLILLLFPLLVCGGELEGDPEGYPTSFRRDIAPILIKHCVACHGPKNAEGEYRVDSFALVAAAGESGVRAVVAGDLAASEAYRRVTTTDIDERMPLDGAPLSSAEISLLRSWIEEGSVFDGADPGQSLESLIPARHHPDPPDVYRRAIPITAVAFSHAGDELFVSGYYEVTVWRPETGKLVRRISNLDERTMSIDVSPNGELLAVGGGTPGRRGELRILESRTGQLRGVLGNAQDIVLDTQFSPDGQRVAAATADNRLLIFDSATGAEQLTLASHSDWVTAVAWSSDGTQVATASRDKTVKVFSAESGDVIASYAGHGSPVASVLFHPKGAEILSAGADQRIHSWNIDGGKKTSELRLRSNIFRLLRTADKMYAAATAAVHQIDLQGKSGPTTCGELTGHGDWVFAIDHHAHTNRLASGSFDGEVRIWDSVDQSLVQAFLAAPAAGVQQKE